MSEQTTTREGHSIALRAHQEALRELTARHFDEWEQLRIQARVRHGLPAQSGGPTREKIIKKLERYEEQAAKLREQLEQLEPR